jgi:integrase
MRIYSAPQRRLRRGKLSEKFYARVYDTETGKRTWESTGKTSIIAAREQMRAWELGDARGEVRIKPILFPAAVKAWVESKRSKVVARWLETCEDYSAKWVKSLGDVPISSVTLEQLKAYLEERSIETVAATRNKERAMLKQLFTLAVEKKWTRSNPAAGLEHEKEPPNRKIRALSLDEERKLLATCLKPAVVRIKALRNAGGVEGGKTTEAKSEWEQQAPPRAKWLQPLVFLALKTGLRYGTLDALEWGEVSISKRLIRVPKEKMKTKSDITIPLDDEAVEFLRRLKSEATSMKVLDLPERGNVKRAFARVARDAEVLPCRFHDLRATFITRLRNAGVDLEIVAQLAGHADVKTTLKYYRQISDADARAGIEAKLKYSRALDAPKEEAHG